MLQWLLLHFLIEFCFQKLHNFRRLYLPWLQSAALALLALASTTVDSSLIINLKIFTSRGILVHLSGSVQKNREFNVGRTLWTISDVTMSCDWEFIENAVSTEGLLLTDLERVRMPSSGLYISSPFTTISWRRLSSVFRLCCSSLQRATVLQGTERDAG